jgi:hypothetical protein
MIDLYNEDLIQKKGFRCKDCKKLMHEHTFSGKHVSTGAKNKWGGDETKWVYDEACAENFRDSTTYWHPNTSYPNLIRVDGLWYHLSYRAIVLGLIANADLHLRVDTRNSLVDPKPTLIDSFGDMYNFATTHGILHKLQAVVDADTFKSMQSKSIARSIKKLSA